MGESLYFCCQLDGIQSILVGKVWWQDHEAANHFGSAIRKQTGDVKWDQIIKPQGLA